MISSNEFQQKLQTGQIQEAFALIVRDLIELDVTTRMTEGSTAISHSENSEYLSTKINLLTGEIQNEVGKDLIVNSNCYLKLHQLHIDQIAASRQIVQDYLDRIKAMVTVLSPTSSAVDIVSADRVNSDFLVASLTPAHTMVTSNSSSQQFGSTTAAELAIAGGGNSLAVSTASPLEHRESAELVNSSNLSAQQPSVTSSIFTESHIYQVAIDDNIDLSIDEEGTVWEEWIEAEDIISESGISQSRSTLPVLTIPDRSEHSVRRNLHPIDIKPTISRSATESADASAQWDEFVPEYVGISANSQPQMGSNNNSDRTSRLFADLDI
jgi:hypothetical protein